MREASAASAGPPGAWAVRAMQLRDVADVAALASEEPTAPHWPLHEYHRMLDVIAETPARRAAWVLASQSDDATPLAGFAMALQVAGTCELEAVVVRATLRGNRLGGVLVEAAITWARQCGATRMELEARASNTPALRLYSRLGFTVDGTRSLYYRNPDEDAVLMSHPL